MCDFPMISAVTADPAAHTLSVSWNDGTQSAVALAAIIANNRPLSGLADPAFFAAAQVGPEGYTVAWRDDLELSADQLWRWAGEQAGTIMPTEAFAAWRKRHHLTQSAAAAALGLSLRQVAYYESGEKPVPLTIKLATVGYDALAGQRAA